MSVVHMEYYSDALQGRARFNAILPDFESAPDWVRGTPYEENYRRPPRVMVMLHGYTGGESDVLLQTGMHPGQLKDAVCSPAGSTIQGVRKLEENSFRGAVMDAIIATVE